MSTTTHGMSNTPTWLTWKCMRDRITKPHSKDFKQYGARGLDMDPRWNDFCAFFADMGERPEGKTIGRIDNSKGYWPDNCRWETALEQCSNRRSNRRVVFNGKSMTIAEIARLVGASRQAIRYRIERGWSTDELSMQINHGNGWKRGSRNEL